MPLEALRKLPVHALGALALLAAAGPAAASATLLSVGIGLGEMVAEVGGTRGVRLKDPATGKVLRELWSEDRIRAEMGADGRIRTEALGSIGVRSLLVQPVLHGRVVYEDREYHGQLLLRPDPGGGMNVINIVDVEDYLLGVLPREMSPSAPRHALEAQAIASRTYALKHAFDFQKRGFGLKATEGSQVYAGVEAEQSKTSEAVRATAGQVLTHGGELVHAWFSAACGGRTASSTSVWGGKVVPYARPVECGFCKIYPSYHWTAEVSLDELSTRLEEVGKPVGQVRSVDFRWDESGRVVGARVVGSRKDLTLGGNRFRILAGHRSVRSLRFVPMTDPIGALLPGEEPGSGVEESAIRDIISRSLAREGSRRTLDLEGTGFGHGVGLCQWGARGMAEKGWSAHRILRHYYRGASVGRFRGFEGARAAAGLARGSAL